MERALGDWVVYYEPRRVEAGSDRAGGRQAYFAAARITGITRDAAHEDRFYAGIADYLPFAAPVPFREGGQYYESMLQRPDGGTSKGAFGRAVRNVPDPEFDAILTAGFSGVREELGSEDWADAEPVPGGFHDPATPFRPPDDRGADPQTFPRCGFCAAGQGRLRKYMCHDRALHPQRRRQA